MVHGQVPEREVNPAAVAVAFLPSVKGMAVSPVVRDLPEVGPVRNVRPGDDLAEGTKVIPESLVDELDGQR